MTKLLSWWMILPLHVIQLVFDEQVKLCIPKHCFFICFFRSVSKYFIHRYIVCIVVEKKKTKKKQKTNINSSYNVKNNFYEIFTTCQAKNSPKIKNAQKSSKFATSDISSRLISILMSKIIFMKYLPPGKPKLVPKIKMLRIY